MIKMISRKSLHVLVFTIFFFVDTFHGNGHEHSHHGHSHDPNPAYKYSREANMKTPKDDAHSHSFASNSQNVPKDIDPNKIWIETIVAVTIISLIPAMTLKIIPDIASNEKLLNILLGFAAGGLLGDAFFHLIPHSMENNHQSSHEHAHSHDLFTDPQMRTSLYVLSGILSFLVVEKSVRLLREDSMHSHSHNNLEKDKEKTNNKKKEASKDSSKILKFKVSGCLNLAADFAHNFTDGLAIGASFIISRNVGIVTTLTVLVHEFPHEIGDFAILVQAVTALGAFLGACMTLVGAGIYPNIFQAQVSINGNIAHKNEQMSFIILPFTAGGFIYIALVTVLPELLISSRKHGMLQSLLELFAMVIGVVLMIIVGLYE